MLREKAVISQIGCKDLDIKLLSSVFKLSPDLNRIYEPPTPNEKRSPDVVFIDAEDPSAIQAWKELHAKDQTTTAIMVTGGNKKIKGFVTIRKPIAFKSVLRALNAVGIAAHKDAPSGNGDAALKVLVVDDSLPVRKFMEGKLTELSKVSLLIEFAASGEEAAHKIKKASRAYDIIFLDVVMPGVDGYKVCKWIKGNYPSHVIMLTSKKSPFDKVRGAMSGCNDYLTKPPLEERLNNVLLNCIKTIAKRKGSGENKIADSAA